MQDEKKVEEDLQSWYVRDEKKGRRRAREEGREEEGGGRSELTGFSEVEEERRGCLYARACTASLLGGSRRVSTRASTAGDVTSSNEQSLLWLTMLHAIFWD